ncbi:hypothetical protein D3C80_884040 [compost metagenome]
MVDVAGQQHLVGVDVSVGGAHSRRVPMDDLQHFAVLEDQRTEAFGCAGLADAQVERVQVHVAGVLDRAVVEVALQQVAHLAAVEQADLVAHATVHRLFVILAQAGHVRGFVRGVQVAVLEVAGDAVFFHALPDDLVPAPAQVPDEIIDFITDGAAHLFAHGFIARQAAGDLAAIAPGGTPADLVAFDDGDLQAFFRQLDGGGHAGEAAADDHHVNPVPALQRRVIGVLVEGGGVVGIATLSHVGVQAELGETNAGQVSTVIVGAGLLAKRPAHPALEVTDTPLSRASPLPQVLCMAEQGSRGPG